MKFVTLALVVGALLVSGVASAETTKIRVQILESGEVRAWEEESPGATFDESLVNLAYPTGAMMVHLEPILTLLGVVLVTEDGTSPLKKEATEQLLSNPPKAIEHSVRAVTPLVHRVDSDGTFEKQITGPIKLADIRAWFSRLDVPRRARDLLAETETVNIRYLERWLQGAKDWSQAHAAVLYDQYPALRSTDLVAAFQTRTVQHLMEHLIIQGMLYDFLSIGSVTNVTDWIDETPLSSSVRSSRSPAVSSHSDTPEPFRRFTLGKPVGASNGAAFTYRPREGSGGRSCVTIGEPHQPSLEEDSPQSRAKIFQLFTRDDQRNVLPILFMSPAGLPTPALSFSPHHGMSGTAGPSLGALNFFAPLQGTNYQAEDGRWLPLVRDARSYEWAGESRSFTVYSIPGFGEVFARLRDPSTGSQYVALRRPKSESSPVDAYLNRLRYGAKNDQGGFLSTVGKGGLTLFGEAGCHPTDKNEFPGEHGRAYYALNQGRTDRLFNEEGFALSNVYPIASRYRKIDSHDTPFCNKGLWAVADNGSLASGCPQLSGVTSKLLDPGFPTFRQVDFAAWARRNVEQVGALSRPQIVQFATSTASSQKPLLLSLLRRSFVQFGHLVFSGNKQLLAAQLLEEIALREGKVIDDGAQIVLFAFTSRLLDDVRRGRSALPQLLTFPLLLPLAAEEELAPLIDEGVATVLNTYFLEAIDLFYERCLPAGVTTWRQMTEIQESGEVVATRFVGPGDEARMSGLFELHHEGGVPQCRARLRSTSPFSFIAFDTEVFYRSFGAPLSPHTLEPGLHQVAAGRSWRRIEKISDAGFGYSELDSYNRFPLTGTPADTPSAPVFASYEFSVARTTAGEVRTELLRLRKMLLRVLEQEKRRKIRKAISRQMQRVRTRFSEYQISTFHIDQVAATELNLKRALKFARVTLSKRIRSQSAVRRLKRLLKMVVLSLPTR